MGFSVLVELSSGCRVLHARDSDLGSSLRSFVEDHVCLDDYFLTYRGRLLSCSDTISSEEDTAVVRCIPRLLGGKGGFGSMLRTIGNQIEKTTNKDACRDLNGRRIRDVKADKQVEEWQKGESERERLREEARRDRRQRLLAEPKSTFDSHTYLTEMKDQAEKTEDAVRMGLAAQKSRSEGASASAAAAVSVSAVKRSASSQASSSANKRKCATMRALDRFTGDDFGSSSDSDDSDSESSAATASRSTGSSDGESVVSASAGAASDSGAA